LLYAIFRVFATYNAYKTAYASVLMTIIRIIAIAMYCALSIF